MHGYRRGGDTDESQQQDNTDRPLESSCRRGERQGDAFLMTGNRKETCAVRPERGERDTVYDSPAACCLPRSESPRAQQAVNDECSCTIRATLFVSAVVFNRGLRGKGDSVWGTSDEDSPARRARPRDTRELRIQ